MDASLRFAVSEIKEKGFASFKGPVAAESFQEALGDDASLVTDVAVELDCRLKDEIVALKGVVSGKWDLPCSRCLTPGVAAFRARLEGTFELNETTIDGVEEVRQALVLAVPMRFICKPDCKGL
jgi:uncharacterized metal-binding protein YceD (DUF177 family)